MFVTTEFRIMRRRSHDSPQHVAYIGGVGPRSLKGNVDQAFLSKVRGGTVGD